MNLTCVIRVFVLLISCLPGFAVFAQEPKPTVKAETDTLQSKAMEVVILSASRVSENLLQSPVSVEKAGESYFARNAAPSFFDALQSLKGVQMITPSLGFRVINTRGFTNTTNVRFAQLVNGMDMQSPHIGAPVGNALGPTDLDIQSVEIIPGSASALYGMNAINGMANFFTKNPFTSQGLSIQQKTGLTHVNDPQAGTKMFSETSVRYAHAFSQKFALKLNGSFSKGYDWIADDRTDLNANANSSTGLTGENNPAKDPVNGYGNESSNRRTLSLQGKNYVVARTGYFEKELADYSLQNIKADIGFYYKPSEKTALDYTYHRADFNTIYQRANRFRLQGYVLQQHALNFASPSVKAKAYVNLENTGKSFNLRSMAENMDRLVKTDDRWFAAYSSKFNAAVADGQSVAQAHQTARTFADAGRPLPGTPPFEKGFEKLQNINNWDSGAALRVRAAMVHGEVQVDLTQNYLSALKNKGWELLTGADIRTYVIEPDGNYFINPEAGKEGQNLLYGRWGGYFSATKTLLQQKLKAGLVTRLDKNDYFSPKLAFRATAVYSPSFAHNFRIAYQNGYRYPSIFEAFSNVNSGGVKRVGGLRVMSDGVFESSWLKSAIDAFQAAVNRDINTSGLSKNAAIEKNRNILKQNDYTYLKPEHILSLEGGYRGLVLNNRLFIDLDFYFNQYKSFIAQVEASTPNTNASDSIAFALFDKKTQDRYRLWTNSKTVVHNYGTALKLQFAIGGFVLDYNVAYTKLVKTKNDDGLEDGFNTPQWMMNAGLTKNRILKNLDGGVFYRWQDSFYWQSFLVSGDVPAQGFIDLYLNYTFSKTPLRIRFGANNLLNHYEASFLGGPQAGGFYYTALTVDLK